MKPYTFEKAANTNAALRSKNEKAQFIAGGTNLVDLLKKKHCSTGCFDRHYVSCFQ